MAIRNLRPEWGEYVRFRSAKEMEKFLIERGWEVPSDGLKLNRDYEQVGKRPGKPPKDATPLSPDLTDNDRLKEELAWSYAYGQARGIKRLARRLLDRSVLTEEWEWVPKILKSTLIDAEAFKPERLFGEGFAEYSVDGRAEVITGRIKASLVKIVNLIERFEAEQAERAKVIDYIEAVDDDDDITWMLNHRAKRGAWNARNSWYVKLVTPKNLDVVRLRLGAITSYAREVLEGLIEEYGEGIITTRNLTIPEFVTPEDYRSL